MRRILLDTHAWLWFVFGDRRMGVEQSTLIADPGSVKLLSVASLWEVVIKVQLGKLNLGQSVEELFEREVYSTDIDVIGLDTAHLLAYAELPLHHRDPFDRLLIAQAQHLGVPIVTADRAFAAYEVETIWR